MKAEEFKQRAVRHGEVMLIPIASFPEGLEKVESKGTIIVGHSESGHHHVAICDTADLSLLRPQGADSPDLYLEVSAPARIKHLKQYDRHETKPLAVGFYKIVTKSGYDYFLKRQISIVD
jgi:hypothetical protein